MEKVSFHHAVESYTLVQLVASFQPRSRDWWVSAAGLLRAGRVTRGSTDPVVVQLAVKRTMVTYSLKKK